MRIQLLSDLHLETEAYEPEPAPGAELLVLAGDIDSRWQALELFRDWPQRVLFVAGNHEFDGRDLGLATAGLRARCAGLGITMLERESVVIEGASGERVRFLGTTRWCDFDLYGPAQRERSMSAGKYFAKVMRSTRNGAPFDAAAVREEGLQCRAWLQQELRRPRGDWDKTVVITDHATLLDAAPSIDFWRHGERVDHGGLQL